MPQIIETLWNLGRRYPELPIVTLLMVVTIPVFWLTHLDVTIAQWFYNPELNNSSAFQPWPLENELIWQIFYKSAWAMAGLFALTGAVLWILARVKPSWAIWGPRGLVLVLVVVLGSGLVINAIFKDQTGRYRPRQVECCGGIHAYQPPFQIGIPGEGKSFPCGHCSSGFAFMAFWLIWRRQRPYLAKAALVFAITLGVGMGIGRLAAGGHFISDTLWAGILMFWVTWLVYYKLVNVPKAEERIARGEALPKLTTRQKMLTATTVIAVLLGASLAKPYTQESSHQAKYEGVSRIHFSADDITLHIRSGEIAKINSETHSFGLPGNRVIIEQSYSTEQTQWDYSFRHQGLFTERDSVMTIQLPATVHLEATIEEGDVYIHGDVDQRLMDIETKSGVVDHLEFSSK